VPIHFVRIPTVFSLALATITLLATLPANAAQRRFTVADDIGVSLFQHPDSGPRDPNIFSPNGRYFVVQTERGLLDRNRSESTLRVYATEAVHRFLSRPELTREPAPLLTVSKSTYKDGFIISVFRWLADSSGVAFMAKAASGNDQLFLADIKTRTVHALTMESQHITGFDIRDERHFVYTALTTTIQGQPDARSQGTAIVETGHSLYSILFPTEMSKGYVLSELWAVVNGRRFQVKDKLSRPLRLYLAGQQCLALSPDGASVVTAFALGVVPPEWETLYLPLQPASSRRIKAGPQNLSLDGFEYVSEYVLISLLTGEAKPLTNTPIGDAAGWWGFLRAGWSADGKSIALTNTFLPLNAQKPSETLDRPCIVVVDLARHDLSCLERLKGQTKTRNGYEYEDDYHLVDNVQFAHETRQRVIVDYYLADESKGSTSYVRSADGSWTADPSAQKAIAQESSVEVSVRQSLNDPPVLVATDPKSKQSQVIWDPNPQLKGIDLGEASVFKWKDETGRNWIGGLYKPPNYVEGYRYPLVIQNHGFLKDYFLPSGLDPTAFAARELAAAGILVLQVQDCPYSVTVEEGPCNVAGYEAAVRQLSADGLIDAERVGIIGFSRTCYYVMEALTTSAVRFKAAAITDGITRGYLQYITEVDTSDELTAHESDAMIGAQPFASGLQQWLKRSPEFNMEKVSTPLQVVALGASDVLFMWEPYAALRYLHKPVDLIVLGEGSHVLTNPAQRMSSQGGTVDWFRFWLKDEEDPDPVKVEQYERWRALRELQATQISTTQ
jgi:dipeptidyl aminopeptidase/acylaminoacyl peptidase